MQTNAKPIGFEQVFSSTLKACYVDAESCKFPDPKLVYFNKALASTFNASLPHDQQALAEIFSGQTLPSDAKPIAQAYAGHQFGHFNPQLGDGRAMILGELKSMTGQLYELDLKGSGPTPFSRGGDGKAALGPMLREVLIAEAMHALGVATTRSLAVVATNEEVYRDPPQPGAVLARTASSHVRIGTFQYFAARDQYEVVEQLVAFCIKRHYPKLINSQQAALDLLKASIQAQATLVAKWMGLGFIHGVMNTDNMLIGAETIDYGPCAFMDTYDENTVFSSIDRNSRYSYINQAPVAQWNLSRLAETLLPLINEDKDKAIELATEAVRAFNPLYTQAYRELMCSKLGLNQKANTDAIDSVIFDWTSMLKTQKLDWTNANYALTEFFLKNDSKILQTMFTQKEALQAWLDKRDALGASSLEGMNMLNPAVIPRNHLVEQALKAASENSDFAPFNKLLQTVTNPYQMPSDEKYTYPAPSSFTDEFVTYCGT